MTPFDVALGIDNRTLNEIMKKIHKWFHPHRYFTGSRQVPYQGITFTVGWDVTRPPIVDLTPPEDAEARIRTHLAKVRRPKGVTLEQLVQAYLVTLRGHTLQLVLPKVTISVSDGGTPVVDDVRITVYVHVDSSGGSITLQPVKAEAETGNDIDTWFFDNVFLPEAIKLATPLLKGIELPAPTVAGVNLTASAVVLNYAHLALAANLAGKPVPDPGVPPWPGTAFFALLGPEALSTVGTAAVGYLNSKVFRTGDSIDVGIGTVDYGASAWLGNATCWIDRTTMGITADVAGNAYAGITIGCTRIGVNYDIRLTAPPTAWVRLAIDRTRVNATIRQVSGDFSLYLTPTGNIAEWILSAITSPVATAIANVFKPAIVKALADIVYPVCDLPSMSVVIDDLRLTVNPVDLELASYGRFLSVQGDVIVE
ncbi:hypothetical protein Q5530_16715 [Saccharothrix sp. BKS2]|uniref:hypothetical protein n=1 Tax=Saccharothrix sp. BKS2 TaxID=3064400 RepID=UPI0039EC174B